MREGENVKPEYRNFLVFCDESGMHGSKYYGFGSLWLPWERRGDLRNVVEKIRQKYDGPADEIKWKKTTKKTFCFYKALAEAFFETRWLWFHCLTVNKEVVDMSFHRKGRWEEARLKHLTMLLDNKIDFFVGDADDKRYHIRFDPIPARYRKADEVCGIIANNVVRKSKGFDPIDSVRSVESKKSVGIQMADLLLGAVLDSFNNESTSKPKHDLKDAIANCLGWENLGFDTYNTEWKFNIWNFYDPKCGKRRSVRTENVNYKYPTVPYRRPGVKSKNMG